MSEQPKFRIMDKQLPATARIVPKTISRQPPLLMKNPVPVPPIAMPTMPNVFMRDQGLAGIKSSPFRKESSLYRKFIFKYLNYMSDVVNAENDNAASKWSKNTFQNGGVGPIFKKCDFDKNLF